MTAGFALNLIGLAQCAFILVLIIARARNFRQVLLLAAFFFIVGLGFAAATGRDAAVEIAVASWLASACVPAFAYLVVLQLAKGRLPDGRHLILLALPALAIAVDATVATFAAQCDAGSCDYLASPVRVAAALPSGVVVLLLWWQHANLSLDASHRDADDRNRIVSAFVAFIALGFSVDVTHAVGMLGINEAALLRTLVAVGFVYIVTFYLFRIEFKPVVSLTPTPAGRPTTLNTEELMLADRIDSLMTLDKLYQEPAFCRADLARELGVSENILSRVINKAFGKSFRKLLNDHRVEEAKQLLRESDSPITQIAFDVGFNSLASFNRVFKEAVKQAPSAYRAEIAGERRWHLGRTAQPGNAAEHTDAKAGGREAAIPVSSSSPRAGRPAARNDEWPPGR